MELRQLNTFTVVVEMQGFTRAAEVLGYAQSSITAQIQALEEEIGSPLFERLGKRILLTAAGERLLPYAKEMVKLHSVAKEQLQEQNEPTGTLTIGAPESLAAYRLPSIIQQYRKQFPRVTFVLKPGLCWELRNQVRTGQLDVAFVLERVSSTPDLVVQPLAEERMVLIAPTDHTLVKKESIKPEDLRSETILSTEPGCSYRAIFDQQLQQHGIYTDSSLEFWNIEAIKHCVMCGLGISLLPLITVKNELESGRLAHLAWDDRHYQIMTQLVYHKGKWMSPALQEFLKLVHTHSQNW